MADWLHSVVTSLGENIQKRIGSEKPLSVLGDEYFRFVENIGYLESYRHPETGNQLCVNNQCDYDGFHILKSAKPVDNCTSGDEYIAKLSLIVYGREQKTKDWRWLISKSFRKKIQCDDASARIKVTNIIHQKHTIIQKYWPDFLVNLTRGQFCLELAEFEYQIEATNCKC